MLGAKMKDWDQESDGDWKFSFHLPNEDSFREIIPSFFSELAISTLGVSESAKRASQDGQHKFPLGETLISDLISTPRELTCTIEEHVAYENVMDKAGMGEGN